MSILVEELIMEILLWLPVKSLLRFQSVSKSWLALINDPSFIKMHMQRSKTLGERILFSGHYALGTYCLVKLTKEGRFDEHTKAFQSSIPKWRGHITNPCNGLFCACDYEGRIVIWNPSIRKHKMIPPVKLDASDFHEVKFNLGLGYDPVNNDYKVVNILQFSKPKENVLVYSLKENSWRRVEDEWPFKDWCISGFGVYLNGKLHWLVMFRTEKIPDCQTALITFDLTIEKFQVHPFPVESPTMLYLQVMGGKLCVCTRHLEYKPLVISEDGQEILIKKKFGEYFWYDREKKISKTTKVLDILKDHNWVMLLQENLVLIDGDNDD